MRAYIGSISIKYNLPKEKTIVCDWLINGGECPLTVGDVVTYEINAIVEAPVTNVSPVLQVTLNDQDNLPVVCFRIDSHVHSAF